MSDTDSQIPNDGDKESRANPTLTTAPEDAFRGLWSDAVRRHEQNALDDPARWRPMLERMNGCRTPEDVCLILDETMQSFERFRGTNTTWGKLRNGYLKPAIEVLLLFNEAIAETAASFVRHYDTFSASASHVSSANSTRWQSDLCNL